MKKIFNLKNLVIVLFMILLFPLGVKAKVLDVSGTDISNGGSINSITGSGSATYDVATNILTLNNYKGEYIDISEMPNNLTIKVIGTNTLNGDKNILMDEDINDPYKTNYYITLHHDVDINIIGDSKETSKLIFDSAVQKYNLVHIDSHDLEYNSDDDWTYGSNNLTIKNVTLVSNKSDNFIDGPLQFNMENSDLLVNQNIDGSDFEDSGNIFLNKAYIKDSNIISNYAWGGFSSYDLVSINSNYTLDSTGEAFSIGPDAIIDGGIFNISGTGGTIVWIGLYNYFDKDDVKGIVEIKNATINISSPYSYDVSGIYVYSDVEDINGRILFENTNLNINNVDYGINVNDGESFYDDSYYDLSKEELEDLVWYPVNIVFKNSNLDIKETKNALFIVGANLLFEDSKVNLLSGDSAIYFSDYDISSVKRNEYYKQGNLTFKNSDVEIKAFAPRKLLSDDEYYIACINSGWSEEDAKYEVVSRHYYEIGDYNLETFLNELRKLGYDDDKIHYEEMWAKIYNQTLTKEEVIEFLMDHSYTEEEALEMYEYYYPEVPVSYSGAIVVGEANINFESGNININANGYTGIVGADTDINFKGANVNINSTDYGIYLYNNGNRPATLNFNDGRTKIDSSDYALFINDGSDVSEINFDKHMGLRNFDQVINMEENKNRKFYYVVNNEKDKKIEKNIEVTKKYYFVDMEDINKEIKEYSYDLSSKEDFIVRIDGALNDFLSVEIDGNVINKDGYELSEGSTIIKFNKKLLEKLTAGKHTITVNYKDYGIARTSFKLAKGGSINPDPKNPNTLDTVVYWGLLSIVSLGGLVFCKKSKLI